MDIEFGPTEPERGDANWIQTIPGQHCFSYFRLYGPLETYFDRSWKLGDITAATEDLPLRTEAGCPTSSVLLLRFWVPWESGDRSITPVTSS